MLDINFNQCVELISNAGQVQTIVVRGQPGIGKTAMGKVIAAQKGLHEVTIDCATMVDGGDITIPWMMGDSFRHVPNTVFGATEQVPSVICLDEIGKANRSVIAAITPLLRDRKIAGIKLHPETIIYATSNNISDGVGDNIPAHIWNGVTAVQMRNPTAEEWINGFALHAGVCGEVIAWAHSNPQIFEHYTDGTNKKPEDNVYIFNPFDADRQQYVSCRSLERVSRIIERKGQMSRDTLLAAVSGTVGHVGAHELITLADLGDQMPLYADVIDAPTTVPIPAKPVVQIISAIKYATRCCQAKAKASEREAVATYAGRLREEVQALFIHQTTTGPYKGLWVVGNAAYNRVVVRVGNMS